MMKLQGTVFASLWVVLLVYVECVVAVEFKQVESPLMVVREFDFELDVVAVLL